MVGIEQQLDGNISDALYAANAPSASNAVATKADITQATNTIPAFADEKQYLQITNFDSGSLPVGWTGSVNLGTIVYTQVTESGVSPGMALATLPVTTLARVAITIGSGYQYMPSFIDSPETTYFIQMRWSGIPSPTNSAHIFGWINTNSFTPLPTMGNALAIMYDPSNASTFNPTLITNLFLIARSTYNGATANTVVDLGVPYDTSWRSYKIVYDNVLGQVRVFKDNVLLTTLSNMANVPGGSTRGLIPTGATNGLQAGFYVANQGTAATTTVLKVGKISIFKRYS